MGSYLEIDGKELNSKGCSSIIINIIRQLEERLPCDIKFTKQYNSYSLSKKGIAVLIYAIREEHGRHTCYSAYDTSVQLALTYLTDILVEIELEKKRRVVQKWT